MTGGVTAEPRGACVAWGDGGADWMQILDTLFTGRPRLGAGGLFSVVERGLQNVPRSWPMPRLHAAGRRRPVAMQFTGAPWDPAV